MSNVEPDLMITPATGKTFVPDDSTFDWIYDQPSVKNMCCVLSVYFAHLKMRACTLSSSVGWGLSYCAYSDEEKSAQIRCAARQSDSTILRMVRRGV